MNEIDIPILKKSEELYKLFHDYRKLVSKSDKFTIYERCENLIIDVIGFFIQAGSTKTNKLEVLERASVKLNMLRLFIRIMKDNRIFDTKKYIALQKIIDEIGRMLGGWIRSTNSTR